MENVEIQSNIKLSGQFETLDAQRLQYLLELATIKKQPLDNLLKELVLSTPPSAHA